MQAIVVLMFIAADTDDAAARKEVQRLEGRWKVVAVETRGKTLPPKEFPLERVVFAASKPDVKGDAARGVEVFTYRPDPSRSPAVIEAKSAERGNTKSMAAVYRLDGADSLKLCLVRGGASPPKDFKSGPDDGAVVLELKREKP